MRAIAIALGLALADQVAAGVSLSPTRIDLAHGRAMGAVEVANQGDRPRTFQADVVRWPRDGADAVPGSAAPLVVAPPSFVVAPNGRQVVRAGCLQGCEHLSGSFRLRIREVPEPAQGGRIPVVLALSLPVFIGAAPADAELRWAAESREDGWALTVENRGVRGDHLTALSVKDAQGRALAASAALPVYILEGTTATFSVEGGAPARVVARWGSRQQDVALE